ncbi:MAG: hypothetical protein IPL52_04445 [Flavobacteriales bacterium]|nr:hypothetical protein [Flavobacteriales bacterium]
MKAMLAALLALPILITSCNKEPGEGGRAEIRGVVYEQRYNSSTGLPIGSAYPLADYRVAIIYGNGDYADDDTRTGPTGEYRFPWLRKGDYRLYVISECNDYQNCTEGVYASVSINDRKDVVQADTLLVRNY